MKVGIEPFEVYTAAGGWVRTDPSAVTAIVRAFGAGATLESLGSIIGNKLAVGCYYADVTNSLYTDDTEYELLVSATVDGESVAIVQPFVFVDGGSTDRVRPGEPTVSVARWTDTTVTLNHTPPVDADYSTTRFTVKNKRTDAHTNVQSAVSGEVELSSLSGDTGYIIMAVAVDDAGNRSDPRYAEATTKAVSTIAMPETISWFRDGHTTATGSRDVDPSLVGKRQRRHLRVRAMRLCIQGECCAPVAELELASLHVKKDRIPLGRPGGFPLDEGT